MSTITVSASDAGCWIEGHWGIYGVTRLLEIAENLGMPITDSERSAILAYENGEDTFDCDVARLLGRSIVYGTGLDTYAWIADLADVAEGWLNREIAPEGYSFGWHDGEFYLWSDESWSDESF